MSFQGSFTEVHQFTKSYKHMWARDVAKSSMDYDLKGVIERLKESVPAKFDDKDNIGSIREKTKKFTGPGYIPEEQGRVSVGIVGAGVAGLFAALLFDWLNDHEELKGKGLKISYDILEAAGAERLGGRLYTHHFSHEEHDYYDVGAMRFPNNTIMKRTFQLFHYIGITRESKPGLIPYYLKDEEGQCPAYFNDITTRGNVWDDERKPNDPYKVNKGLPECGKIPPHLLKTDPSELVRKALKGFTDVAKKHFDAAIEEERKEEEEAGKEGFKGVGKDGRAAARGPESTKLWKLLMRADHMSVRQFLGSGQKTEDGKEPQPAVEGDFPKGPGYNYNTIEWLETMTYGTGWYDQSLTECVLEELDFHTPDMDNDPATKDLQYWWCIDGGAQEIAKRMALKIKKRVEYNTKVQSINAQVELRQERKPGSYTAMKIKTTRTDPKTKKVENKDREYFAIFNSTTLGALQRMELSDAGLSWGTKQAIRALGYGASAKVGMKFRTAWWQTKPFYISKGGVSRTDLPLRVCVYPSYNIKSNEGEDKWDPTKPAVLLCSYTWGQDAQRIGALCSNNTTQDDAELKRLIIHDLARLHARKDFPFKKLVKFLEEQYIDHHGYDWYRDQYMSGAFAYFGPGQFSNMWQEIIKPNALGQLYLVGEAASSHHAWIVGALESVIRAVYVMFQGLQNGNEKFEAYAIVLKLLSTGPDNDKNVSQPLKKDGDMPTGSPFHPLPEEMPIRQLCTTKNQDLTANPEKEANVDGVDMTYGAALAVLSLIESFYELGVDKNNTY
ncbi:amino-acid oxidase [Fusarium subglutinans]|uniref:Amino-acid oxidase n=1 Tax=Gibberella subglutinans TaxID=42677 RepID=A0A8H5PVI3_GIBSU|nr:amino-acid oxidase [Fusarium subglutinans]KAF5603915.1 amino-acid oxidase [Fusarium subglutinans]